MPRDPALPARWRVTIPTRCDRLDLDAGTVLELTLTDHTFQGCAGCENHFVWSRYRVVTGEHAGSCVVFQVMDPRPLFVRRAIIPGWVEPVTD